MFQDKFRACSKRWFWLTRQFSGGRAEPFLPAAILSLQKLTLFKSSQLSSWVSLSDQISEQRRRTPWSFLILPEWNPRYHNSPASSKLFRISNDQWKSLDISVQPKAHMASSEAHLPRLWWLKGQSCPLWQISEWGWMPRNHLCLQGLAHHKWLRSCEISSRIWSQTPKIPKVLYQ
jgi:hypothetical protein